MAPCAGRRAGAKDEAIDAKLKLGLSRRMARKHSVGLSWDNFLPFGKLPLYQSPPPAEFRSPEAASSGL